MAPLFFIESHYPITVKERFSSTQVVKIIPYPLDKSIFLCYYLDIGVFYRRNEILITTVVTAATITTVTTVTTIIAGLTRRPLGVVDLIRILCWTVAAVGLGVSDMAGSYYNHYWPEYTALAKASGHFISGTCLLVIVAASLMYPAPKRYPPQCCSQCGYDLTGNTSGICPECGERVSGQVDEE